MAVPIKLSNPEGPDLSLNAGAPALLFQSRVARGIGSLDGQQYTVRENGQRFLINTLPPDTATPISTILNWHPKE